MKRSVRDFLRLKSINDENLTILLDGAYLARMLLMWLNETNDAFERNVDCIHAWWRLKTRSVEQTKKFLSVWRANRKRMIQDELLTKLLNWIYQQCVHLRNNFSHHWVHVQSSSNILNVFSHFQHLFLADLQVALFSLFMHFCSIFSTSD